jgi:hypothetical protein
MLVDQRAASAGVKILKLGVLGSQQLGNYCHVMIHDPLENCVIFFIFPHISFS